MNNSEKQYLSHIRGNSAYSSFRNLLRIVKFLGYISITVSGIIAFVSWMMVISELLGFVIGILVVLIAAGISIWISILILHFVIFLFLMLADLCDSTIQKNADEFQGKPTGGKVSKAAMEESGLPFVKKNAVENDSFKSV